MQSSVLLLVLLQLPFNLDAREVQDYKDGRPQEDASACSWSCLMLTLQWPSAFCQSLDEGRLCQIPQSIHQWTIHGLWPLEGWRCCDCWPIFPSDIQELQAELNVHWPSLLKTSGFHFWRSEWQKHGSCAACVEGINSPLRYFQLCLKLRRQFDIDRLLEDAGITPSCDRPVQGNALKEPRVGGDSEASGLCVV
uniref:Ribonuclease T2, like n=1 Tax=Tetraodon nigroviridis TaxID=99883 RepID=H3C6W6_TETNG